MGVAQQAYALVLTVCCLRCAHDRASQLALSQMIKQWWRTLCKFWFRRWAAQCSELSSQFNRAFKSSLASRGVAELENAYESTDEGEVEMAGVSLLSYAHSGAPKPLAASAGVRINRARPEPASQPQSATRLGVGKVAANRWLDVAGVPRTQLYQSGKDSLISKHDDGANRPADTTSTSRNVQENVVVAGSAAALLRSANVMALSKPLGFKQYIAQQRSQGPASRHSFANTLKLVDLSP